MDNKMLTSNLTTHNRHIEPLLSASDATPLHRYAYTQDLQKVEGICRQIFQKKVHSTVLNHRAGNLAVSPLHLAVMKGSLTIVRRLLQANANVNQVDGRCWTPLHHAAANRDLSMILTLLKAGADIDAQTDENGSMADLGLLVSIPLDPNKIVVRVWNHTKKASFETSAARLLGPGLNYTSHVHMTHDQLIDQWAGANKRAPELPNILHWQYEKFLANPPKLAISHSAVNDVGEPIPQAGRCTIAEQDFVPGQIVAEYCGEQVDDEYPVSNYRAEDIDGDGPRLHARSAGTLAADGFPNCAIQEISRCHGRTRLFIVAIKPIERGSLILLNYGQDHRVKYSGHREMAPAALNHFVSDPTVLARIQANQKKGGKWDFLSCDQSTYRLGQELRYLLETPSAYVRALFQWHLPFEQLMTYRRAFPDESFLLDSSATLLEPYFSNVGGFEIEEQRTLRRTLIGLLDNGQDLGEVIRDFLIDHELWNIQT